MSSDISGFPELLPGEQIAFNEAVDKIKGQFELFGFIPMDTPAVERLETLLAKGNDNEIYGIYRVSDPNARKDLALRFDLTVPFARYVVSRSGSMIFPHRRYQISPVWRGERPQQGRYRQFYQCDIDIVGEATLSLAHDAEIIYLIVETIKTLGIQNFVAKINNRKMLHGFLKTVAPEKNISEIIRIIDKMGKISTDEASRAFLQHGMSDENIEKLYNFTYAVERSEDTDETIQWLRSLKQNDEFLTGVAEIEEVWQYLKKWEIDKKHIKLSARLARGLNYYTGTVFEVVFDGTDDFGSIAGGGRYDNLASTLSSDKIFPGVGASIGISRLAPKLFEMGLLTRDKSTPAELLVTVQNRSFLNSYMRIAHKFRKIGVKTEVYLQEKSLGAQMNYANRRGFRNVLIANDAELQDNRAIIRNLVTKEQTLIETESIGTEVLELLIH
ncbi:MAG: histidine--tRNA ligase [Holosporaceae bacterium]|jgi:histidyl-tRNA synthetase|nr:histidine--tRNA ligase [Holosporaceae bacterium]